jgi:hypothetical protein
MTPPPLPLPLPPPPLPKRFEVHAAFSYSSADADYVGRVAVALPKGILVHNYKTQAWIKAKAGLDLEKTLEHVYQYEAMFVFAFISEAYFKSDYTQREWKAANRAAKHKPGYLIPVRIEETKMPVPGIWLDGTLPAERLADLIEGAIRRPPPKPWWFYVSMEVKVAAAAAVLALILFARPAINFFRPSRTSIASVAADAQAITMHVKNRGPKSAALVGQRLKFGTLPIEDAELRLDTPAAATIAPGERDVKLIVRGLLPKCNADGNHLNNVEIEPLLGQHNVTFEIKVQESDDAPGHPSTRVKTFPAALLRPFVRKWVPGRVTPC